MEVVDGEWVFGVRSRTVKQAVLIMQRDSLSLSRKEHSDLRWIKTKQVRRRGDRHMKLYV
jgi:hypothetical protein